MNATNTAYNALTGTIPLELGGLTNLQHLSFFYHDFHGTIPGEFLANLTQLTHLDLDGQEYKPPGLSGSIPTEIGSLTSLTLFFGNYNSLTGSIPSQIGALGHLETISLDYNQLSDPLPSELGRLTNLGDFFASQNTLTGLIPTEFGQMNALDSLLLCKYSVLWKICIGCTETCLSPNICSPFCFLIRHLLPFGLYSV